MSDFATQSVSSIAGASEARSNTTKRTNLTHHHYYAQKPFLKVMVVGMVVVTFALMILSMCISGCIPN